MRNIEGINKTVFEYSVKSRKNRVNPVIMVVEDDEVSLQMLGKVVSSYGEVVEAENGVKAIKNYSLCAPDIVFLDIELPDMTGVEILAEISAVDQDSYVIMLTSHTEAAYVKESVKRGAKGYLAKPFKKDRIEHYIKSCAAGKKG